MNPNPSPLSNPVFYDCSQFEPLDFQPSASSTNRQVFDLFEDFGDIEELGDVSTDFPASLFSNHDDDNANELLSIPSFESVILSRTVSQDDCFFNLDNAIPQPLCRTESKGSSSRPSRIPESARLMLNGWFGANSKDPYLKVGDAGALAHLTGLTEQQVKTYMANKRVRIFKDGADKQT